MNANTYAVETSACRNDQGITEERPKMWEVRSLEFTMNPRLMGVHMRVNWEQRRQGRKMAELHKFYLQGGVM